MSAKFFWATLEDGERVLINVACVTSRESDYKMKNGCLIGLLSEHNPSLPVLESINIIHERIISVREPHLLTLPLEKSPSDPYFLKDGSDTQLLIEIEHLEGVIENDNGSTLWLSTHKDRAQRPRHVLETIDEIAKLLACPLFDFTKKG